MSGILPQDVQSAMRQSMDSKTTGLNPSIPGVVYQAVNSKGEILFNHASGALGLGQSKPMRLDTPFYLASFTKLITSIACMQMVERGKLRLDDASQVAELSPELRDVKVLQKRLDGTLELVEKNKAITLRMLLNHTAGFGYAFEDFKLLEWSRPCGLDDFSGFKSDVLDRPLVNQPGEKFQYGTSMDWAGVLVERISGQSLEAYFQQHILGPVGIRSISFFPSEETKSRLAYMHQRAPDGTLKIRDHLYRYPLTVKEGQDEERFCMGGAGCFGSPVEYTKILATLLNNGTSPSTGSQILKPETVDEMFKDQIADKPRDCNEYWPSAKPEKFSDLANSTPLVPAPEGTTEGWGLSFSLSHSDSETGRRAGSGSWEGLANLFWFIDRKTGLGAIIASQIMPYGDLPVIGCMEEVEAAIYRELEARKGAQANPER